MANVRVPDDTQSLHNIGKFIMNYQPYMNAFLNALPNRIGKVLVTSKMWDDPWAVFEQGEMELGESVEEIFANIAKAQSYDPSKAESSMLKREIPDVRAAFHVMNWQKYYKDTVSQEQLAQAFVSWSDITQLVAYIFDSMYSGMNLDTYLTKKYMLCREALNGGMYTVVTKPIEGDGAEPSDAVERYREYTNNLTFLKTTYNRAGVRNSTPIEEQVIIVSNRAEAVLGVQVLANAFNLNQVDYLSNRIAIDSFEFDADDEARLAELFANDPSYVPFTGDEKLALQKINAMKMDKRYVMVFTNHMNTTSFQNGEGEYWNYWLHIWKTFSLSPFANAIVFTTQDSEITSVTVTPETANVSQGTTLLMNAAVEGTGLYEKTVSWSITADAELASGTNIDGSSGALHIARDETAGTAITVTATAKDGQTGTATITVTAA